MANNDRYSSRGMLSRLVAAIRKDHALHAMSGKKRIFWWCSLLASVILMSAGVSELMAKESAQDFNDFG